MAVYTHVDDDALRQFLMDYAIGSPSSFKGIAEGVENTNYLLETDKGRFILTLYEKRVRAQDLPFFLSLMSHLAQSGLPAALPIARTDGNFLSTLCGKNAAIIGFVPGLSPEHPNARACANMGAMLAKMHLAVQDFSPARANDLSVQGWINLRDECGEAGLEKCAPGLSTLVDEELADFQAHWPTLGKSDLPAGVIHADLFPDNAMFDAQQEVSGLIDFYFACTDFYAYDLAICLNAWCFAADHQFLPDHAKAFIDGYQQYRPLSDAETNAMGMFARGATLRFLLTRAYDWLNQVPGAVVRVKNPQEYITKLEFHRKTPDAFSSLVSTPQRPAQPVKSPRMLKIYTDGACSGNPGPGGWGIHILDADDIRELCGGEPETTNNRMELMAAIEALRQASSNDDIHLYTDSTYVKDGLNKWMANWKRNGWKTAAKKPVKNKDLWVMLDELAQTRRVTWFWVKGHAGDPGNERADELARQGLEEYGRSL